MKNLSEPIIIGGGGREKINETLRSANEDFELAIMARYAITATCFALLMKVLTSRFARHSLNSFAAAEEGSATKESRAARSLDQRRSKNHQTHKFLWPAAVSR